jgi:hypothetical protein
MANTTMTLFRGAASTSSVLLHTSPIGMAECITNIAIVNTTASSQTATINLQAKSTTGGSTATVPLLSAISVAANSTQFIDLEQVIFDDETITGSASSTSVHFHIAGFEV